MLLSWFSRHRRDLYGIARARTCGVCLAFTTSFITPAVADSPSERLVRRDFPSVFQA